MGNFFSIIIGNLLNFVRFVSHAIIVLFHNAVLLAFVLAFFYGIFLLFRHGWARFRGLWAHPKPPSAPQDSSAPKDEQESGRE